MKSNFPPSVLIKAVSIAFTCPGLGIQFGLARSSARLGSGWLFGWTQGLFRFSTRDTRTPIDLTRGSVQFAQGPDQLEARLIAPRGSARFARGTDQLEALLIAPRARLGSLFAVQPTSTRESESAWGSTRGSENQLNAWLS